MRKNESAPPLSIIYLLEGLPQEIDTQPPWFSSRRSSAARFTRTSGVCDANRRPRWGGTLGNVGCIFWFAANEAPPRPPAGRRRRCVARGRWRNRLAGGLGWCEPVARLGGRGGAGLNVRCSPTVNIIAAAHATRRPMCCRLRWLSKRASMP